MNQAFLDFVYHFHNGSGTHAFEFLGCHPEMREQKPGFVFRIWAPNAKKISVVGDFNFWNPEDLPMVRVSQGIWQAWSEHPKVGSAYKYLVTGQDGKAIHKADPVGFRAQKAPDTSSVIHLRGQYLWHDGKFLAHCARRDVLRSPVNIYEVHLGSWRQKEDGSFYSYREIAPMLVEYVQTMGFTHVELMPLAEYPYDPSWGYQVTHYFSPTARYGEPDDLKFLVDSLHMAGIGVILDWVPAHFPKDAYGLYEFDGSCCYEYADEEKREHPDWGTRVFDFGKNEVRSFLISSAVYWLKEYHFDGLRVDAVSSMLFLDYSRSHYTPNRLGGRENLEAVEFVRQLNTACFAARKGILMAAEESHAFPMVTMPVYDGGLGFSLKWNMGWMNDTLKYMSMDPLYRKYHHDKLTFSMAYAFSENFVLPLSHDEVVHGKLSLVNKMPGDYFWKFANLRLLRGYQMAMPGKKLLMMGSEFGQFIEWDYRKGLDWLLLDYDMHRKMQDYTRDLNAFYRENPPLWADDGSWNGYQWIQPDDADHSILAFRRIAPKTKRELLVVLNFTPVPRPSFRLGVGKPGVYEPVFCSDEEKYGGSGNLPQAVKSEKVSFREYSHSACFHVPPMSLTIYKRRTKK